MTRISLDTIRDEATALEIDMTIVDGFLCLSKRGDPSCFYDSAVQVNDPQVLEGGWQWLQQYRGNLQRIDEISAQLASGQTGQVGGQIALVQAHAQLTQKSGDRLTHRDSGSLFLLQCFGMLAVSSVIGWITNSFLLGMVTFLVMLLTLVTILLKLRRRASARRAKQHHAHD